ncbi:MAG: purine-nucleoside phosphorylase [Christensenellaceae bacterium]|jgi:purine-nucleoside phosphorylase|nr:purine-nucleoside phosphorylase [Christensenellaceae bacterium]
METELKKIVETLKTHIHQKPDIAVIAGGGLGGLIDKLEDRVAISFDEAGLKLLGEDNGSFFAGRLGGKNIIIAYGRLHSYNGYEVQYPVLPVYAFEKLGCKTLILSCAGGAIKHSIKVGDIVVAADHINLSGKNPLYGTQFSPYGERFVDLNNAYSPRLITLAKQCGKELGIKVKSGVLVEFPGPTSETAAEVKMSKHLGGSVLGFHVVKEVIAARYAGMDVFVGTLITNYASAFTQAKIGRNTIDHNRETAEEYNSQLFIKLIERI